MKKVFELLLADRKIGHLLLISSLSANILALASSIFVMQVLGRYVSYGVDATLATLTIGTLAAILFEYLFRHYRLKIARSISSPLERSLSEQTFERLVRTRYLALETLKPGIRQEIPRAPEVIAATYNPANLVAVLDVPFAILFLLVILLFNPILAGVSVVFCGLGFWLGTEGPKRFADAMKEATEVAARKNAVLASANSASETVRAFGCAGFLAEGWKERSTAARKLLRSVEENKGVLQHLIQGLGSIMSVAIIAIGGILVVHGKYDVSSLVGVNILASRALGVINRFAQLSEALARGGKSQELLNEFGKLGQEASTGGRVAEYHGKVEFRDFAFSYPRSTGPVLEGFGAVLAPGEAMLVQGPNGSGKTTFARLVMGILDPSRGQLFADGVDIRQLAPDHWRRQVIYLPQEVTLLNMSIEENLMLGRTDLTKEEMATALGVARLKTFINQLPEGVRTVVTEQGRNLSLGIRRRLGLARALLQSRDGRIVLFDEPNEGLDGEGRAATAELLAHFRKAGRTIIVVGDTSDLPFVADHLLDLTTKPTPTLRSSGTPRNGGVS
ncbi:Protease secretion ATP-binding protein prtD [Candidatus Terasakiella magnetica]|nr:Protease secretion ATP-binding protein prtD [Candidatus Terasakiella magnetica]